MKKGVCSDLIETKQMCGTSKTKLEERKFQVVGAAQAKDTFISKIIWLIVSELCHEPLVLVQYMIFESCRGMMTYFNFLRYLYLIF